MAAKILVVEDNEDLFKLLEFILKQFDYEVTTAVHGKEALETLKDKDNLPDVIICDIMMPEMDGYTLITHLLENENTGNIPVIVMTGKGQTRELFQDKDNVCEFVEKPFEPSDLKTVIEKVLTEHGKKHS